MGSSSNSLLIRGVQRFVDAHYTLSGSNSRRRNSNQGGLSHLEGEACFEDARLTVEALTFAEVSPPAHRIIAAQSLLLLSFSQPPSSSQVSPGSEDEWVPWQPVTMRIASSLSQF